MNKLTSWTVNVETTRDRRDCDIIIIFCPVTSRVAADVDAAMRMVTGNGERIYRGSTQNSLTTSPSSNRQSDTSQGRCWSLWDHVDPECQWVGCGGPPT